MTEALIAERPKNDVSAGASSAGEDA